MLRRREVCMMPAALARSAAALSVAAYPRPKSTWPSDVHQHHGRPDLLWIRAFSRHVRLISLSLVSFRGQRSEDTASGLVGMSQCREARSGLPLRQCGEAAENAGGGPFRSTQRSLKG